MDSTKKAYDPIDDEVINLKGKCLKDPATGLLALFDAMAKYQDHRDFFKIKEVFINQIEQFKDLPELNDQQADKFIECCLVICQKHPSPLASRTMKVFFRLLKNESGSMTNKILAKRFKPTKQNITRLGIESYFDDKDSLDDAISYGLFLLMNQEYMSSLQIFENPKIRDLLLWTELRSRKKIFEEVKKYNETRGKIAGEDEIKYNEVKLALLEMKNELKATQEELANFKKKTVNSEEFDKYKMDIKRQTDEKCDETLKQSQNKIVILAQSHEDKFKELDSAIEKQNSTYRDKMASFETTLTSFVKNFNGFSEEKKRESQEIFARNMENITELSSKIARIELNLSEANVVIADAKKIFTNLSNRFEDTEQARSEEFREVKEDLAINRRNVDRLLNELQEFNDNLSNLKLNVEAKFDRLSEIKIGELGSRIDEFHIEFEEMRKEMDSQVARIGTFTSELNKFPEELARVNRLIEKDREIFNQGINDAMKRCDNIEDDIQRRNDKITAKLTEHLKSELSHFEFDIDVFKQEIQRMKTSLDDYIIKGNENLSQRIGQISINVNVLNEKRIEDDNTINSLSKLVSQVDNKISQICHYVGIDFDINTDLEVAFQTIYMRHNDKKKVKEIMQPIVSNLSSEIKSIAYKLPLFQKKITTLFGILRSDEANDYRDHDGIDELGPLTLEDLNQSMKLIRTQLITEIRETQNAVQYIQNKDVNANQDLINRIEDLEKQNREGVIIKKFKRELDDVYENMEKLRATISINQNEPKPLLQQQQQQQQHSVDINFLKALQERVYSLELELYNLKKIGGGGIGSNTQSPRREYGNTTGNPLYNSGFMVTSKMNDSSSYHLALLEIAVKPPLEDKISAIQEKLFRSDVYLNEKFYAYLALLSNYRFVNVKFFAQAFESFKSLIPSSSKNQIVHDLKKDNYPYTPSLLANQYDCYFPNFAIVLQTLNLLLTEESVNNFMKKNSLPNLCLYLAKITKSEIIYPLLKLLANLFKYDLILEYTSSKKLVTPIYEVVLQYLEILLGNRANIKVDPSGKLSVIAEERVSQTNITWNASNDFNSGFKYIDDFTTIIANLNANISTDSLQLNLSESSYQYEIMYYSFLWIFYASKRGIFLANANIKLIIKYCTMIMQSTYPIRIMEMAILVLLRITERINLNQSHFDNLYQLEIMVNYASTLRDQPKLQKYLVMSIANLANKDENLKNQFKAIGEYHLLMQSLTIENNKADTINPNYVSNSRIDNFPTNPNEGNVLNNSSEGLSSDVEVKNHRTNISIDSGYVDNRKTPRSGLSSGPRTRKPSIQRERSDSRDEVSSQNGFDPLKLDPNYRSKIRGNKFQLPTIPTQNLNKSFK